MATSKSISELTNKANPALTDKLLLSNADTTPPTDRYSTIAQIRAGMLNYAGIGVHDKTDPLFHIGTASSALEVVLGEYTLPANALSDNGMGIEIDIYGDMSNIVAGKEFKIKFGSYTYLVTDGTAAVVFNYKMLIHRISASSQVMNIFYNSNDLSTCLMQVIDYDDTLTQDLSLSKLIQFTAKEPATNGISRVLFKVKII